MKKGSKMTEEQKKRISEATKKAMQRPEVKAKIKASNRGANFHTERPEVKAKISKAVRKNWENDKYAKKCSENQFGVKTEYRGILFRSKSEAKVAKCLYENNIEYEYESRLIKYIKKSDGLEHNYRPDFYLPDYDLFLEVKYRIDYSNEEVMDKINKTKAQGINIMLVDLTMLNKLPSIINYNN